MPSMRTQRRCIADVAWSVYLRASGFWIDLTDRVLQRRAGGDVEPGVRVQSRVRAWRRDGLPALLGGERDLRAGCYGRARGVQGCHRPGWTPGSDSADQ
eukprot:2441859-Rhodomonas_salina.3